LTNFGSGWTWLVQANDGKLAIRNTDDAGTPFVDPDCTPVLGLDIWEHAYYIDYRNGRGNYI
jgi:Fe-Mn family superoxide dismutase